MRMFSLRSMAASSRSTAAFIPDIKYGECRSARDGVRKRAAASGSAIPRMTSKRARVEASCGALRARLGLEINSAVSSAIWAESAVLGSHVKVVESVGKFNFTTHRRDEL